VSNSGILKISPKRGSPTPSKASSTLGSPLIVRAAPAVFLRAPLPAAG